MIHITGSIFLQDEEISESFVTASGPGGQHVNKNATAVQLRFDAAHSPSLPEPVRRRLLEQNASRLTSNGVLVITSQKFREQARNRADALEKLVELIQKACIRPKSRRPTKPSKGAKKRRLESKRKRSQTKNLRGKVKQYD